MLTKTKVALAAVLMLGVASAAQAGSKDDETGGGFRVGPLGQVITDGVNPVYHRSLRGNAEKTFASAAQRHFPVR